MIQPERLTAAYQRVREALLAERTAAGHWVGELSSSALSTATAIMALQLVNPFEHSERIIAGWHWLVKHQNADGGWGDTVRSRSNLSTAMLVRAAFRLTGAEKTSADSVTRLEEYVTQQAGATAERRAEAIRRRYGRDRTFSVPILMSCALAGLVPWQEVPRLPFELAALPQSWYRFARLPVVSYALPALIAIGQCIHAHRGTWNPLTALLRRFTRRRTLRLLRQIQPASGGYLEATPLTSFVIMALACLRQRDPTAEAVIAQGVQFLVHSQRPDGSWPIDTNLATWVTTLAIQAFAAAGDLSSLKNPQHLRDWLLQQQYRHRHPYTGAAAGGWAWTDLPGGVPDCDDTPSAILALGHLLGHPSPPPAELDLARQWLCQLQNRDGGFPTFCRGWGKLPFDRSGPDLTAHALRALRLWHNVGEPVRSQLQGTVDRAWNYLRRCQQADGSWLPLWFGNEHAPDETNPVYGTCRVLAAYRDWGKDATAECQRGVEYLLRVQNSDGGWGGAAGCPSSVEETALCVEILLDLAQNTPKWQAAERGLTWLIEAVESERFRQASPIGLYFARLWYYEKLYPLIFTLAALGKAVQRLSPSSP
ncbi:MAG: squalene--hopene cyclase [Gemmataceae bacterium]|jgi:squalene-hopene/tetraprenyl-beta-curcumene cyclase|nr:MAG: squalene--hopene cyclase [Gemmataceae bacterium]